jgi:hypothetical protein
MRLMLIFEIIGYFGILALQIFWAIRGILTEKRFALFQVASLGLIMITAVLYYSSPKFPFGFVTGTIATVIFFIIGYPIARWAYRQIFPPK